MRIVYLVLCSLFLSLAGCAVDQPDAASTDDIQEVVSTIQPDGRGGLESAIGPVERASPERSQELFQQHSPSGASDTAELDDGAIYGKGTSTSKMKCWFDGECNYCCNGYNCCGVCSDNIPFCG